MNNNGKALLEVRNLKKYYPIKKGIFSKVVNSVGEGFIRGFRGSRPGPADPSNSGPVFTTPFARNAAQKRACLPLSASLGKSREFERSSASGTDPNPLVSPWAPTLTVANREVARSSHVGRRGGLASIGRDQRASTALRAELPPTGSSGSPSRTGLRTRAGESHRPCRYRSGMSRFARPSASVPTQHPNTNSRRRVATADDQ